MKKGFFEKGDSLMEFWSCRVLDWDCVPHVKFVVSMKYEKMAG